MAERASDEEAFVFLSSMQPVGAAMAEKDVRFRVAKMRAERPDVTLGEIATALGPLAMFWKEHASSGAAGEPAKILDFRRFGGLVPPKEGS